jgi:Zn-dependent protease with chaperone function
MRRVVAVSLVGGLLWGCAVSTGPAPGGPATPGGPVAGPSSRPSPPPQTARVDPAQAERLQRLFPPLLRVMDRPRDPSQIRVGIAGDASINAGNADDGQFLVTTGLLQRANDEQLLAVLAHEVAHEDLGHVAKAQALGAGINIAGALLGNLIPGSGVITPIAGTLVARAYGRSEEYAADAHAVTLLRRMNRPDAAQLMSGALEWIKQQSGGGQGGFFSTHPGTDDRIERLQKLAAG